MEQPQKSGENNVRISSVKIQRNSGEETGELCVVKVVNAHIRNEHTKTISVVMVVVSVGDVWSGQPFWQRLI